MVPGSKGILTTILVDGDAAGNRSCLLNLAQEFNLELIWVCNYLQGAPALDENIRLTVIKVDAIPQAADEKIMNLAGSGCVVVTGDLGLASVCISLGALAISPRGHWFWEEKLAQRMELRHIFSKERRAGRPGHGPPGASHLDDERFEQELRTAFEGAKKE